MGKESHFSCLWPPQHAAYAQFVRRPATLGAILLKTAIIDSALASTAIADLLTRASAAGETRRVPDQLRSEWVDTLRFETTSEGQWRIIAHGLRGGGGRHPIDIEARLNILPPTASQTGSRLLVTVGPTGASWAAIGGGVVPLAVAAYDFISETNILSAVLLVIFGLGLIAFASGRIHGLVSRAWPGLLAEVQR